MQLAFALVETAYIMITAVLFWACSSSICMTSSVTILENCDYIFYVNRSSVIAQFEL